jgi:Leucine-rich repeat (LRR) protein
MDVRYGVNEMPLKWLDKLRMRVLSREKKLDHLGKYARKIDLRGQNITSLKGMPDSFPNLEVLDLGLNYLESLEYFPQKMPKLKELRLHYNALKNLVGLPVELPRLEVLLLEMNQLESLVGLPVSMPRLNKIFLLGNPIRALHGVPPALMPLITKSIRSVLYIQHSHYNMVYNLDQDAQAGPIIRGGLVNLPDKARLMIERCIDQQVYEHMQNSRAIFDVPVDLRLIEQITEYYQKSPQDIVQQFFQGNNVSQDDIDRLGHEGGFQERQILENISSTQEANKKERLKIIERISERLMLTKGENNLILR